MCGSAIINQSSQGSPGQADIRVNYVVGRGSEINAIICYI